MIFNFRFDRSKSEVILKRLEEDQELCQGWGGGPDADLDLEKDDFRRRTKEAYGLKTTRIPTNLTRIRQFRDGDLIVTPHLPEDGKVSIHEIAGDYPDCYRYEAEDRRHLNHRIMVRQSWGLDGQISASNELISSWKAKLPWLRLPVLGIERFESSFQGLLAQLREDPEATFEPSPVEEHLESLLESVLQLVTEDLREIAPMGGGISFESVCEVLLHRAGYDIEERHVYDGEGGDADFICVREREDFSPFESGETRLFVQVKKYEGETGDDPVVQLLKIMGEDASADGCVMSLGETYSESTTELAKNNGIVLLNANEVSRLLLEGLIEPDTKS